MSIKSLLSTTLFYDLVCRRYENRAWRGVFGVKQWSYKLETNIKQNAFLPFIMKEQGFKVLRQLNSCIMVNNAIFVILPVIKEWPKNGRGWCYCFPNELNADFFS